MALGNISARNELELLRKKEVLTFSVPDDHHEAAVIHEINKSRDRVNQLRAMLVPCMPVAHPQSDIASYLFDQAQQSLSTALQILQNGRSANGHFNGTEKRKSDEEGDNSSAPKRRRHHNKFITVTHVPHSDGYDWRKYGNKHISNSKYPRSYYRCTHRDDQGCQATKTVQKEDDGDEPRFIVSYGMDHTCKTIGSQDPIILDSGAGKVWTPCYESNSSDTQQQDLQMASWRADARYENHENVFTGAQHGGDFMPDLLRMSDFDEFNLNMDMDAFEWQELINGSYFTNLR